MCLIKGKEQDKCEHMTCLRFAQRPRSLIWTKKALFFKRADIHRIKLSRYSNNKPNHLKVSNPHKYNSDIWVDFEDFRKMVSEIKAVGEWPNGTVFKKRDIDIQYFLYARRIGTYNPLKRDYDFAVCLDVEEAAVYCGPKETADQVS